MTFPITQSGASVFALVQNGGAFNTSILGSITSCSGGLTSTAGQLTAIAGATTNGLNFSGFSGMDSSLSTLTATGGPLDSLTTQVSSQFANLADHAGLYIGQQNLANGLGAVGSSLSSLSGINFNGNPCAALSNFFGSITGVAGGLLQTITGAIQTITATVTALIEEGEQLVQSAIDAAVSAITGLISTIEGAAAAILNQIATEIAAIASALADLLNYGIQSVLGSLFGSQCGKELLNAVGSPALLSALGSV